MSTRRVIFWDQLSWALTRLRDYQPEDALLMCESMQEASYVMRHFAKALEATINWVSFQV